MDAPSFTRRAGSPALARWNRVTHFFGIVLFLFHPALFSAEIDIPDRPPDYLMDRGRVLTPEKAREMSAALNACARDYDIHIYIMTVPTLGVLPSRGREKIDNLLEIARSKWLADQAGALVIFDYESGAASMAESEEARRVFSAIAMNLVFADPQLQPSRKARSSEQLERAAHALIKRFSHLRMRAVEDAKRRRANMMIFWGITGGALLLLVATAITKKSSQKPLPHAPRMTADD